MQIPFRLAASLNRHRSVAMLLALGFSTVVLISTPFLIPAVAEHYDVGLTAASLVGVTQLGGFAVGSWGAGRRLTPQRAVLVGALLLAIVANTMSASLPPLELLLMLRFASGLAIGTITWFAWANAFGREQTMSRVAIVGPIIGVAATPLVALVVSNSGIAAVFVLLAVLPLIPLVFVSRVPTGTRRERSERRKAIPTARVVLVALMAFSFGGSAVFQFGITIAGRELGLSPSTAAIAYTANALVSIPAAGWKGRRTIPSPWMALTGICAFFVATAFNSVFFFAAVILWGFCYWMAIPGVFTVLSAASAYPEERAGDAHAMMALGRVVGPLLGGLLLDSAGPLALATVGSALMLSAAGAVFAIRGATQ